MSSTARSRAHSHMRPAWSGLAIVVEAITLLLFLVWSLSIVTRLFAAASTRGEQGRELASAVALATSAAERFSANPEDVDETLEQDGFVVSCEVEPERRGAGTLYRATITVRIEGQDEPLYSVATARYQRQVE